MRAKRLLFALSFLFLFRCGPSLPEPEGPAVELWGRWEGEFQAASAAAPETVEFGATFESPTGRQHVASGFWDGERVWRVRFMPGEPGVWRYRTRSTPAIEGLDGEEGAFECERAAASDNRFLQHGAIGVAKNGRYFEHADGAPFFWLADTAWNGALLSTEAGWQNYLDDRRAKNFTAVQFVTTQWRTAHTNAEGQTAYSGREQIQIHPEFFQRIDARINAVNAKGLLAVPVVLWTLGPEEFSPGQLPDDQAIRLARYIVARYGAHHVAWFLGGDGRYDGEHATRWNKIGSAVFDREGHAPVFLHPRGMHWPWAEFQNARWLTALGYQSGHGDSPETLAWIHSGPPAQQWSEGPARPVINLEPPYEDHISYHTKTRHSAYNVRRATYWSLLNAPTAGVSYGGHGVWSWETEPKAPQDHERTGVAQPWDEAIHLPGSTHLKHMAELFTSLPWWTLRPAPSLLAVQPGENDPAQFQSCALAQNNEAAICYLPVGGEIQLKASPALEGLTRAEWFDPRTGERSEARVRDDAYSAADNQDWVLVLRKG